MSAKWRICEIIYFFSASPCVHSKNLEPQLQSYGHYYDLNYLKKRKIVLNYNLDYKLVCVMILSDSD